MTIRLDIMKLVYNLRAYLVNDGMFDNIRSTYTIVPLILYKC